MLCTFKAFPHRVLFPENNFLNLASAAPILDVCAVTVQLAGGQQ